MNSKILEIDGLRAVAMTMVIAQHCGLLPFGWIGVWLFYVISGYVITRGFLRDEISALPPLRKYFDFMWRRFFRIVPIYSLYIAINVCIILMIGDVQPLNELPYLFSFLYNWRMIFGTDPNAASWMAFGHLWTLSVEEQFYLLFPLIALFSHKRTRLQLTIGLVVLGPVVRFVYSEIVSRYSNDSGWLAFSVYAASVCHFDAFLVGSLVAHYEGRIKQAKYLYRYLLFLAAAVFSVYVATYIYVNISNGAKGVDILRNIISGILYGQRREVFVYMVINCLAAVVVIHAIRRGRFSRILAHPFVYRVGAVSYGGYLFHILLIWSVHFYIGLSIREMGLAERIISFLVVWLVTVAIAFASYRWVEMPIAQWGRGLQSRRQELKIESVCVAAKANHDTNN